MLTKNLTRTKNVLDVTKGKDALFDSVDSKF